MDIRKIKKLIELVEESGITELEVQEEEGTVRISRAAPAVAPAAIQYAAALSHLLRLLLLRQHLQRLHLRKHQQLKCLVTKYVHQWWVHSIVAQVQKRKLSWKWDKLSK